MYSLCSVDAGPGMFPYRDVSSLDKICTLTFEVNHLQVGILFLQRKPFPSLPPHNQNWAPSLQRSHFGVSGNSPCSCPTYPCALAFGEQQQGGAPTSPLNSALVSPFFFYIPRKSWPVAPCAHVCVCWAWGFFQALFPKADPDVCSCCPSRSTPPPPISQIAGHSKRCKQKNKTTFIFISFVGSNREQEGGRGKAREGRGGDETPAAKEALLKSSNILIWGEMKINRVRKKYHSRVTGLINAMWKSRKGGACSGSVHGSPAQTHTHTSMHSHSLSLPAH